MQYQVQHCSNLYETELFTDTNILNVYMFLASSGFQTTAVMKEELFWPHITEATEAINNTTKTMTSVVASSSYIAHIRTTSLKSCQAISISHSPKSSSHLTQNLKMRFSQTLTLLAATSTLTTASPLAPRDAGTDLLIKDLLVLDAAIRNITYAAGNYTGGAEGYKRIRESFAQTNFTNRVAYYDGMKIVPRKFLLSSRPTSSASFHSLFPSSPFTSLKNKPH